ncbi:hypothetical protein wVul_0492 [Wolbachia endosymbiont of Armadillidium vulgare str. wVulC]|nr:hypothetical protein wVul_0492 [Wolbachia endosymbiont of Armadillidium vulgare str. wVulC]
MPFFRLVNFLIFIAKASGQRVTLESRNFLNTKVMLGFCW